MTIYKIKYQFAHVRHQCLKMSTLCFQVGIKNIQVNVADINDCKPIFSQQSYFAEVIENNYVGAKIHQVSHQKCLQNSPSYAQHQIKYLCLPRHESLIKFNSDLATMWTVFISCFCSSMSFVFSSEH